MSQYPDIKYPDLDKEKDVPENEAQERLHIQYQLLKKFAELPSSDFVNFLVRYGETKIDDPSWPHVVDFVREEGLLNALRESQTCIGTLVDEIRHRKYLQEETITQFGKEH